MLQSPWKPMVWIAAGSLLALAFGVQSALRAEATDAELVDRRAADQLTRQQLVGIYAGLSGVTYQPPACAAGQPRMFTDVPASNPFCAWIEELARRGITGGCTATEYCPGTAVSRSQMAIFVVRAMEACPTLDPMDEMIRVGGICIDKYENSVWTEPDGGIHLNTEAQIDAFCPDDGQDCKGKIYARSVPGVEPARNITWFQAQQALANSGKRLPTSAEWQMAASGTPDDTGVGTTPCNTRSGTVQDTGANAGCISDWGVNDMVGNVTEWVADWVPHSLGCPGWGDVADFASDDVMCLSGASETTQGPGALIRDGGPAAGTLAGPFAVGGTGIPSDSFHFGGFRGAR